MTEKFSAGLEPEQMYLSLYLDAHPSPRLGLIASDFFHQLRSALDNLIATLVIRNGNEVVRENAFPIALTSKEWKKAAGRDGRHAKWHGLTIDEIAILEQLQPVHRPGHPEADPLVTLQRLNNHDKHEAVHPVLTISSGLSREFGEKPFEEASIEDMIELVPVRDCAGEHFAVSFNPVELDAGAAGRHADLAHVLVTATGPDPEMRMENSPAFDIAFAGVGGPFPFDYLGAIRAKTVWVIEQFAPAAA